MKYSDSKGPIVCYQTHSSWYRGAKVNSRPIGILWHDTGAGNPYIKRYVQPYETDANYNEMIKILGKNRYGNDWNHISNDVGLNCWIGKLADGSVATVQAGPWTMHPWGCGAGSKGSCNGYTKVNGVVTWTNEHWIQFEICDDGYGNENYFRAAYQEACEITAYLCKKFNIDPTGYVTYNGIKVPTILCHQDSYQHRLGSNHGDIYLWFKKYGYNMNNVRKDVKALLNADPSPVTPTKNFNKNDLVSINSSATKYYSGSTIPAWVKKKNWYVVESVNDRTVLGKSEDGQNNINSPFFTSDLTLVKAVSGGTTPVTPPKVKTYTVVTDLPTYTTSANAISKTNPTGTYPAGTYYIFTKYPDGYKGVYNITKDSSGAAAGSWINPSENVKKEKPSPAPDPVVIMYRVRTSWNDVKSQKGAFTSLDNAKACADKYVTEGYKVFDEKGSVVYTPAVVTPTSPKPIPTPAPDPTPAPTPNPEPTPVEPTKVYDLDYPEKVKIINLEGGVDSDTDSADGILKKIHANCTKAIKKILSNYPDFNIEIVKAFFDIAPSYGIDPMMAISQSILETGWFKFEGSSVSPSQNNFCGLGATGGGAAGASFNTIEEGVTAQCQHLFAYGCTEELECEIVDPRFKLVTRGIAPYWQQLAGRWACPGYDKTKYSTPQKAMEDNATYGQRIVTICEQLNATEISDEDIEKYFPSEPASTPDPVEPEPTPDPVPDPVDPTEPEEEETNALVKFIKTLLKAIAKVLKEIFAKKD